MNSDKYGRQILSEDEICNILLKNPDFRPKKVLVDKPIVLVDELELSAKIDFVLQDPINKTVQEFDNDLQSKWYIPEEYKNFDIAKYVLDLCQTDFELQRVGQELLMFQERDMFMLLRYCKYLVDIMRKHSIVWGVGRGSSVSSYVLYLIGIHKIDSIYYDLSIDEFLK